MYLRRETKDVVIRVRTVGPLVSVRPDAELKLEAPARGLCGDILQRLEIALTLAGLQRWLYPYLLVSGDFNKIRVREVKIVPGNATREIVAKTKREVEAIETR